MNSPSKVSRRSNHLLTNPPTTFFLMLTGDLNKLLFDTPNASPHTEFNGQSDLQKLVLIKSIKYVSFPGKCGSKQPSFFLKVSSLAERESNSPLYLLIHLTNTYWNPTMCQTLDQPWRYKDEEESHGFWSTLNFKWRSSAVAKFSLKFESWNDWPSNSLFPNTINCF